jgi:UDP-N-acetylmuramoyl-L-alanyl-D-glutamate--2,6-diaminopimelate ligase
LAIKSPKLFVFNMADRFVTLKQLFAEFPFVYTPSDVPELTITGITLDSREIKPGQLFVAIRGSSADGHKFIPEAIRKGAVAVVGGEEINNLSVPYIRIEDPRQALSWLAAAFYDWPGKKLTVIGVTGTDGKTTTTNLIHQILISAGLKAGMISTVNAVIGDEVVDTGFHVTTPDAHIVQLYMAKMVESGLTHVVLETTSHGWAQFRVDACEFDIGVVTNITHEHLDQHGSYENYRAAKARLFSSLERTSPKKSGNPRLGIINRDDISFDYLNDLIKVNKLSYGFDAGANLRAINDKNSQDGIRFTASHNDFRVDILSSLVGKYNISNCLAALAVTVIGLGIKPEISAKGISALQSVPGRMEKVDLGQDFMAIVDFAHTPNALKVTLETAREMTNGQVISVFGSAGLRDKDKRRMMAETSIELADLTVLTAEDPRTESLADILEEMAEGAKTKGGKEGETFWRIQDRGDAIRFALHLARPGDIVLACGKGHEQSMCFGQAEYPWDDRIALHAALAESLGLEGPNMPYLPTHDKPEAEWLK